MLVVSDTTPLNYFVLTGQTSAFLSPTLLDIARAVAGKIAAQAKPKH